MDGRVNWKRIFGLVVLVWLTPQLLGFLSGLSMAYWESYGNTMQEASSNARTVRFVAIGVAWYLLYMGLLRSVHHLRVTHVAIALVLAELLAVSLELVLFQTPLHDAVYWPATLRHVVVSTLALVTAAAIWRQRSSSPLQ